MWMAFIGAAMSLAGGVMGAQGAKTTAEAQSKAAQANASNAEMRALEAERNRAIALGNAQLEARDSQIKNRAVMGQVRAAYGASGLGMDGSALDVIQATAMEQELDTEKILYRGDVAAVGLTDQATSFRQQAEVYRMGGDASIAAGGIAQTTALLGGAAGAAKSFSTSSLARGT